MGHNKVLRILATVSVKIVGTLSPHPPNVGVQDSVS